MLTGQNAENIVYGNSFSEDNDQGARSESVVGM